MRKVQTLAQLLFAALVISFKAIRKTELNQKATSTYMPDDGVTINIVTSKNISSSVSISPTINTNNSISTNHNLAHDVFQNDGHDLGQSHLGMHSILKNGLSSSVTNNFTKDQGVGGEAGVLLVVNKNENNYFLAGSRKRTRDHNTTSTKAAVGNITTATKQKLEKKERKTKHGDEKYITYKIIQGGEDYNFTFDPNKSRCKIDQNRTKLPILHEKGVADFRIQVQTNLHIAYIGDSVGMQFSQSFQDAAGAGYSQVIRYAWGWWHKFSHIAKVRGGGTVAGLRLTGAFLESTKDCPEMSPPRRGGGWMEYDIREMKRLLYDWRNVTSLKNAYAKHAKSSCDGGGYNSSMDGGGDIVMVSVKKNRDNSSLTKDPTTTTAATAAAAATAEECKELDFDVLVYQLPAGWMHTPNELLNHSMSETVINMTITDSLKYFSPRTLIVQTIPIINNILSVDEYIAVNTNIMNYVHKFRQLQKETRILVMDLGSLSTSLLLHNALNMHSLIQNGTKAGEEFISRLKEIIKEGNFSFRDKNTSYSDASFVGLLDVLFRQRLDTVNKRQHWSSIIPHTCGIFVPSYTTTECPNANDFSFDGQHWCMDTMGGRIDGVLACLLECSIHKSYTIDESSTERNILEERCENDCNNQFMTLTPISLPLVLSNTDRR